MNRTQEKVLQHYREMTRRNPEYAPRRMAEIATGVIAVEDESGECDALFDVNRWVFTDPELWERDASSESPMLRELGLKVLEGVGRSPHVSSIETMANFARRNLSPKGKNDYWYGIPKFFDF